MKERVDATKILREPSVNGPAQDAAQPLAGGVTKLDSADIKVEAKEEDGRKSSESGPPSSKMSNGDPDNAVAVKSEDNNNKRVKVEKRSDNNGKTENGKPGSVGTDSQKSSPQPVVAPNQPARGTTPASMMPSQHGMVTSLEPPFMQQQSEIFVFSTRLANEAADSVRNGHCKSIIQYHVDHPNTKAFLQKNPLSANNFRHSLPPGMMGSMKGQQGPGMIRMPGPSPANWGPHQTPGMEDPGMMDPRGMMPNGPYTPGPRMMGCWPGQGCSGPHLHPSMGPGGYLHSSMMDMENEMMMGGPHNSSNISSNQVPDENLTLEQRQHRSKGLAQLTKIHQMLMGDSGPNDGRHPHMGHDGHPAGGPGMYPCGPRMMSPSQQQALMSQQQSMMSQGGMMPPHGMMSPQHQHMMAHQAMTPYGPGCPPGMVPLGMNGKDQYQAQHDWFHCQREYYMEKQHRMQHIATNRGPLMEPGPPPSYYSSVSQRHGGMSGPTSPNLNGMRMLMPPHGPMGPGMDPEGLGMYGGPPDMCRPPHMGMEPMPGMHGYPPHGMPPQGGMDPGFDPALAGGMSPGMGPGPPGSGGRRLHGSMRQAHMMGPNGMMPGMKGPNQVTLHRAGNPEQFNPETMGGVVLPVPAPSTNSSKPPPSYAQAQKRKRGDDMDDSYTKGNLQQTPSPTKIHYHLSQFEGQELTITKQLNSAYVAGNGGDEASGGGGSGGISSGSGGHFNGHTNSPLHGPGSNKGPHSNSSQTSVHMVNSPAMLTAGPSPHQGPQGPATPHAAPLSSAAPSSGANMRLTHYDPAPLSNGVGSAPHTPNPKPSSMSNITSASLANLAKGVENLSNQMQQNMMQGGPFHSIQVQGQITSGSSNSSNNSNNGSNSSNGSSSNTNIGTSAAAATSSSFSSSLSSHPGATVSSQTASTPSVNNTYIATNMSISQVNVPSHPSMNSYVNMQMQNMNTESTHMNMSPCSMGPNIVPGMMGAACPRPGMPHHMAQPQGMMTPLGPMPGGPSPGMGPCPPLSSVPMASGMNPVGLIPPHRPNSSSSMPATPPTMSKGQFTSPPLSHPQMGGLVPQPMLDVTAQPFPITSSSNSSVHIQQKGHNTIQYLPTNPASSQTMKQRSDMEYNMPRFPSPLHTVDGKNPSSTLQYFPNSSPTGSRPPAVSSALSAAAAMGPEFANQATIAMHQSASMMRSSSIPDLQAMQAVGPIMPPTSMGPMVPMDSPGQMIGPHMSGPVPMMVGPDPSLMGMGSLAHMRPGHSPGSMRPLPSGVGPSSLECVSPIPGMCGYMNNGPSIEQAQAQAQAHAAMMMQGNNHMPVSSPHGHMPPGGGPSPHMGPMPGTSLHGPGGMSGPSVLGPMPGQSPHGPPMTVPSPLGSLSGPSPHGPLPSSVQGMSPHGLIHGPSPHSSIAGPLPPHGHMGHMHVPGMPPGSLSRHPGMAGMRMLGPGMGGMPGHYSMQYPGYQPDYYVPGPPRGHPRQMMAGMMGGPGQPYGMMTNMPGPS